MFQYNENKELCEVKYGECALVCFFFSSWVCRSILSVFSIKIFFDKYQNSKRNQVHVAIKYSATYSL